MLRLVYRAEVFQEDDQWVGLCPDLDVSSFGDNPDEAKQSLKEAVEAFIEGCAELGSLPDVLVESGFVKEGDVWRIRERFTDELKAVVA
jgi:predicted RNase H-like HicB family nuclease